MVIESDVESKPDKEDKEESMRSSSKRLVALLLCVLLISGLAMPVKADPLPEVGPGSVTAAAGDTLPDEGGAGTEQAVPNAGKTPEETGTEPAGQTEPVTEPETEAETEPEELPSGMKVEDYLAIKRSGMNNSAVDVYSENYSNTTLETEDIESGVLLVKRLKKLAQNSEFNAVIFRGSGYMRVRSEANTTSEIVGKLYYNAVATLLGTEYTENGLWYHIESGKVNGYVKSEYLVSGAEAMDLLTEVVTTWVTPNNDAQRLYEAPDTSSDTMALLTSGIKYKALELGSPYIKVLFGQTEDGTTVVGYVPADAVSVTQEAQTAITIADENLAVEKSNEAFRAASSRAESRAESSRQASIEESIRESSYLESLAESSRQAAEAYAASVAEASRQAAIAASIQASRNADAAYQESVRNQAKDFNKSTYGGNIPAGTSDYRRAIVLDAIQYVGILDYVWGGESLVYGADCSGFVRAIFLNHGKSLAHYSKELAVTGVRVVSLSAARPGDLICYHCGASDPVGHVGIYIGNGLVVHSPRTGEKVRVNAADFMTIWSIQNVIGD